jgi:hypothetical protein
LLEKIVPALAHTRDSRRLGVTRCRFFLEVQSSDVSETGGPTEYPRAHG